MFDHCTIKINTIINFGGIPFWTNPCRTTFKIDGKVLKLKSHWRTNQGSVHPSTEKCMPCKGGTNRLSRIIVSMLQNASMFMFMQFYLSFGRALLKRQKKLVNNKNKNLLKIRYCLSLSKVIK